MAMPQYRVPGGRPRESAQTVVRKAPGKKIPDGCAAHVWEKVLELGSEIRQFRADLESYQSADPFPMSGGARTWLDATAAKRPPRRNPMTPKKPVSPP